MARVVKRKKEIPWHDIVRPDANDKKYLKKLNLHPIVIQELAQPSVRTKVERYNGYLFLVYQFGIYEPKEKVTRRSELDIIATHDQLITVRYNKLPFLKELHTQLETQPQLLSSKTTSISFQLTYQLIRHILHFSDRQLHHIGEKVDSISGRLFAGEEQKILKELSYIKRDVSEYRIIFKSQGPLLNSLVEAGKEFWGEESVPYVNELIGEHAKLVNQLEDYRAAIIDFEQTNTQILNARTAQIMKTFTVLAFSTFPLTLIAAILSIPTHANPIVGTPYDFWIIAGGMIAALAIMFTIFKGKRWL